MKKLIWPCLILLGACQAPDNVLNDAPPFTRSDLRPSSLRTDKAAPVNKTAFALHQEEVEESLCDQKGFTCGSEQPAFFSGEVCEIKDAVEKIQTCELEPWQTLPADSTLCSCDDVCPNDDTLLGQKSALIDLPENQMANYQSFNKLNFMDQVRLNEMTKHISRFGNFEPDSSAEDDTEYKFLKKTNKSKSDETLKLKFYGAKIKEIMAGKSVNIPGFKNLKEFYESDIGKTAVFANINSYRIKNFKDRFQKASPPLSKKKVDDIEKKILKEITKPNPSFRHSLITKDKNGERSLHNIVGVEENSWGKKKLCLKKDCNDYIILDDKAPKLVKEGGNVTPLANLDLDNESNEILSQQAISSQQMYCREKSCGHQKKADYEKFKYTGVLNPADGARRTMAAHFQSCNVLKVGTGIPDMSVRTDPRKLIRTLSATGSYPDKENKCIDRTNKNLSYQWGGMPGYRNKELDLGKRMDCSGFITGAFAAAGLKWTTGQKNYLSRKTTANLSDLPRSKNSCIEEPKFTSSDSIKPGDIINASSNHTIIVDKVGEDPFGIEKVKSKEACNSLTIRDFDFTIMQSSTKHQVSGIHRMNIKAYYGHIKHPLVRLGRKVCHAKFTGESVSTKRQKAGTFKPRDATKPVPVYFSILRHKGKTVPNCTFDSPPKVKNGQCIDNCFKES